MPQYDGISTKRVKQLTRLRKSIESIPTIHTSSANILSDITILWNWISEGNKENPAELSEATEALTRISNGVVEISNLTGSNEKWIGLVLQRRWKMKS